MTFTKVHLLGIAVDIDYDHKQFCATLQARERSSGGSQSTTQLEIRPLHSGTPVPVTRARACVPIQPVEVAGVAYA